MKGTCAHIRIVQLRRHSKEIDASRTRALRRSAYPAVLYVMEGALRVNSYGHVTERATLRAQERDSSAIFFWRTQEQISATYSRGKGTDMRPII